MKATIVSRCAGLLAISGLLAIGNVYAKDDKDTSKHKDKDLKPPQAQASEKSKEELKISQEQLSKNVTDANKASKIIGMQVKNMQNEDLGKVKELVIDSQSGKVAYAVVSAGGGLLGGGKMVAVPFEALSLQPGAKNLVMNIKKEELKNAKGFAENNWPSLDAFKSGQTVGIATRGEQGQPKDAVGGTGSDAQKSQGSQSSTNQQSSGSSEQPQPSKSDDSSVTNSAGSTGSSSSNTSGSSDSSSNNSSSSNSSNSSNSNSSSSNSSNSNNSSDSSK